MKIKLRDHTGRVSRLLHRTTPGGELIILDLDYGFRGELFSEGSYGTRAFFEVQARATSTGQWDKADSMSLIEVSWPMRYKRRILTSWSKGSLTALLAPVNSWTPMATKKWTVLKDHDDPV